MVKALRDIDGRTLDDALASDRRLRAARERRRLTRLRGVTTAAGALFLVCALALAGQLLALVSADYNEETLQWSGPLCLATGTALVLAVWGGCACLLACRGGPEEILDLWCAIRRSILSPVETPGALLAATGTALVVVPLFQGSIGWLALRGIRDLNAPGTWALAGALVTFLSAAAVVIERDRMGR